MKRFIALILTLVLAFEQILAEPGTEPKVGATIYDKMNQPIYIPGTKKQISPYKALLINSDDNDISQYARLVAGNAPKELGNSAVFAFGSIGADDRKVDVGSAASPEIMDAVASSIEYYFTNKVFIEKKYKEVLIDLLRYRAEVPAKQQTVDETAIPGTLWVAEQNGVKISMDDVKKEFALQIGAQIDQYAREVVDYYKKSIPNIDKYMRDFSSVLKAYYADPLPTQAKLDMILDKALEIEKKTLADSPSKDVPIFISWSTLVMSTVGKISNSLDLVIANRLKERTAQASLSPVSRPEGLTPP